VNFEFPDENGKPYKSSGGEMDGEIPIGWEYGKAENYFNITIGKTAVPFPHLNPSNFS
jgi:type I restriction enzyme S subunit